MRPAQLETVCESGNTPTMEVCLVTDREAFTRLRDEWNALVESTRDEPFFRHEYLLSWLESFAPEAPLRLLTGRDDRGRLVAALPLIERRARILGVPVREWSSPTNVHSYRFDLVAANPPAAARAFMGRLIETRGWDLLRVTDVPEDGNAWHLYRDGRAAGLPADVYESQRSPFLPLPESYDELARGWSSKFRSNLRRRRRLLEARGKVRVECVTQEPGILDTLKTCFAIEEAGWKGLTGQPANSDSRIRGFYDALARRMSARGALSLFVMTLDGRAIAFHYGLTQHRVYSLVMTGYDESLSECSPGHLLVEEVLKRCIASGVREFDFLGCDLDWKRAWTGNMRAHSWLYLFRDNALGHALRRAKFDWVPATRRLLRSWRQPGSSSVPGAATH